MKISRNLALGVGFASFLLVSFVDIVIGAQVSMLLLHLVPTLFVTWYVSPRWGALFAVAMYVGVILSSFYDINEEQSYSWYWYLDIASDLVGTLLLVWMQARLKAAFDKVERLTRHDNLTGLLNRKGFYEEIQLEIERSKRYQKTFSLVYFDCDNFKTVNDTLGHNVGDALLIKVAATLRSNIRRVDLAGRLGGDEFSILLPESDEDAARQIVANFKQQLDELMTANNWPVSFSIGAATFSKPPDSTSEAIDMADGLMYEMKKSGKNRSSFRTY